MKKNGKNGIIRKYIQIPGAHAPRNLSHRKGNKYVRIMKKRSFFSVFGGILISAVIIFLLYYTMLPAINLKSQDFIIFLILSTLIILTVNFITYMKEFLSGLGSRGNVRVRQNPLTGQIQFETEEREPDEVTPAVPWPGP